MSKIEVNPQTLMMPVPAVMVSCGRIDGESNIITLAWVGTVCSEPPMVSIAVRPHRHSYGMIKDSGEFVVNIPTKALAKATDFCGVKSGADCDKFATTGLTKVPGKHVKAPLIAECPINMECVVKSSVLLGSHELFIGEIVATYIDDALKGSGGRPELEKAGIIGYAQGGYYTLGEFLGFHGMSKGEPK